jgi:uncharacterized protein
LSAGFRPLKVVAKVRESLTITSFYLEPTEPEGWRPFKAGQFLVLRFEADDKSGPVVRTYTVSSAPGDVDQYRITVKRETAAHVGVPDGIGSCRLHDHIDIGDVLMADGPRGDFMLDTNSARPVLLLSGGVGLTPMVSMLHVIAKQSDRRATFMHATDNGQVHALIDEVRALVASRPGLEARFVYRFATEADRAAKCHDAEGLITRELLQRWLPLDDYDVYLCGPPPFMQALYRTLRSLGVAKARIAYEFFGPATVLDADNDTAASLSSSVPLVAEAPQKNANEKTATVTFSKSGRSAEWSEHPGSLLSFAEQLGLTPTFSCRAGVCGSCLTTLVSGEVEYFEDPLDDPGPDQVLLCCARPKGSVSLDL